MSATGATESRSSSPNALFQAMSASLRSYWALAESYQRFVYILSALLIASGLFHAVVFLFSGEPWAGPVSWRKPILFGISFGITNFSLAWVMTFLPKVRARAWLLMGALGIASLVEVSLITMQKWRGVPSHFNAETPFDAAVFGWMGQMVGVVALVIVTLTVWSLFSLNTSPSMAWAVRAGLILLVFGQAFGVLIIVNGLAPETTYEAASIFGGAGQLKVPHSVAIHALQVLPFLGWLLAFTSWPGIRRTRVVIIAAAGYIGLAGVSVLQTFTGVAAIDLNLLTGLLLVISVTGIGSAYGAALLALKQSLSQTDSHS
jgi:uncharacterized membrane protein (DUF485 family)